MFYIRMGLMDQWDPLGLGALVAKEAYLVPGVELERTVNLAELGILGSVPGRLQVIIESYL
jgi:hypothetical protein